VRAHLLPGERSMPSSASSYSWMMCSSWGRKARVAPAITTCGSRHAARPAGGRLTVKSARSSVVHSRMLTSWGKIDGRVMQRHNGTAH
jgi:hypothetical protein